MATAFVSHSSSDKYFTDLLVEILKYHHIDFWYDSSSIGTGKKFKEEIKEGLKLADYLVVVVSENSLKSQWVANELKEFLMSKPHAYVIPLFLSDIPVDKVNKAFDNLKEYQAIFFYNNMLDGFRKLLAFFGKEFLPPFERRQKEDRREAERRKNERRRASVDQRLRRGMWKYYENSTGRGKFDPFNKSTIAIMDVVNRFTRPEDSELSKYDFFDRTTGQKITLTEKALMQLLYNVLERMEAYTHLVEIIVIESLAEELLKEFDVKSRERREGEKRRVENDRRDSTSS